MTYPPQGPYGQQPDPYGQQQPDPYGQQQPQYGQQQQPQYGGGYQQQQPTGQYGYDPNAQQQQYGGGYGQYGGLGGPPQPPKSNKGPIIAVVAIVVVLLAGLGITGFVAPGFFLSDDKDKSAGGGGGGGGGGGDDKSAGADAFIQQLVAAADDKDKSALKDMSCSDAGEGVEGATNAIDEITSAKLKDTKEVSDKEVTAILTITVDGDADDYAATVTKDGTDWCWKDIVQGTSPGPGGGSTSSPDTSEDEPSTEESTPGGGATGDSEGEQFVQSFLDKLNAGDGAGAAAMSCSDSTSQADITEAGSQKPNLEMDPAGTTADSSYVGADLKGTLNGAQASGRTSAFLEDGKWCIYTFFAS